MSNVDMIRIKNADGTTQDYNISTDAGKITILDKPSTKITSNNVKDALYELDGRTEDVDEKVDLHNEVVTFDIATTAWVSDSTLKSPFVKKAFISSNRYTATSVPVWDITGASGLPNDNEQDAIDNIKYAYFDATGITLYAIDTPSVALKLRVKGV